MNKIKFEKYQSKIVDMVSQSGGITFKGSILGKSTFYFCNVNAAVKICKVGTIGQGDTFLNSEALSQNEINGVLGLSRGSTGLKNIGVVAANTAIGVGQVIRGFSGDAIFNHTDFMDFASSTDNYVGYKVQEGDRVIEYVGTYIKTLKLTKSLSDLINESQLMTRENRIYLIDYGIPVNWNDARIILEKFYNVTRSNTNINPENVINTLIELKINSVSANKCVRVYKI